jgi:DNA polymerase III subunit chi
MTGTASTEFGFYHLTRSGLDGALPRLLEKAHAQGKRVLLRCPDAERLDQLDRLLWTYRNDSFLPHGSAADGHGERQPIWLTTGLDRPNGAQVLVIVDGAPAEDADQFERVLELFDGRDADAVAAARERWRWAESRGMSRVYWQQSERGGWQRAASS